MPSDQSTQNLALTAYYWHRTELQQKYCMFRIENLIYHHPNSLQQTQQYYNWGKTVCKAAGYITKKITMHHTVSNSKVSYLQLFNQKAYLSIIPVKNQQNIHKSSKQYSN
jgi:predicted RNA-binding protein with PUA-like domain